MKYTEVATIEGETAEIGRDPRQMSEAELVALGHRKRPLLAAIRQWCVDCSGGSEAEVRRCRCVACPLWPYRMNANPFHRLTLSEDDKADRRDRLAGARASRAALRL
jgi:hypothetical protein